MPQAPFYQSAKWRSTRASYLAKNPHCFVCAAIGFKVAATEVDHKRALAIGGAPFDHNNLQGMCRKHHSQKTIYVDGMHKDFRKTLATTGLDGYPVHVEKPRNLADAKKR